MWTGEFVHGVLEEAYRFWSLHHPAFPWPFTLHAWPLDPAGLNDTNDIGDLGHRVEVRLAAAGKRSRSEAARLAAYNRAVAAVNSLCPHLFPLITAAEERVSGTREMPPLAVGQARGPRYELTGVVDVISSVSLGAHAQNPVVVLVQQEIGAGLPAQDFDLIVDYKAGRRPPVNHVLRARFEWQVQTYAWLRAQVPNANPVGAAILIHINELAPSKGDLEELRNEMLAGTTDVVPPNGSADYYAIHGWQNNDPVPNLTFDFRLRRALHIVDVGAGSVQNAVTQIDHVVGEIESAAYQEHHTGTIPGNWDACGGANDCTACDFEHFCPAPISVREALQHGNPPPNRVPQAPG
jgi:hypothetical protein